MGQIDRGRTEPCKDTLGGVRNVYLWSWQQYNLTQIQGVRGVSLESYPLTIVYKFETLANGNDLSESLIDNNGYEQKVNLILKKIELESSFDLDRFQDIRLGVIVEDYNGLFRLMGAFNGVDLLNLTVSIGNGNADFNGYQLELEARERFKSPLFTNLEDAGFVLATDNDYLLSELFEILTDGDNNRLIYA